MQQVKWWDVAGCNLPSAYTVSTLTESSACIPWQFIPQAQATNIKIVIGTTPFTKPKVLSSVRAVLWVVANTPTIVTLREIYSKEQQVSDMRAVKYTVV